VTDEHPNHKPAHTVIGCVTLIVAIAFGIGACTALTSSNDAPEQDATPEPAVESVESVEPADEDTADPTEEPVEEPDTADTEMTAEDITTLALDITWEQKTPTERDQMCDGVQLLGADRAAEEFMNGAGPDTTLDPDTVQDWLTDTCL